MGDEVQPEGQEARQPATPQLSSRRRRLFRIVVTVACLILLDAGCHVILWIGHGGYSQVSELRARASELHPERMHANRSTPVVPHPYIGAVLAPPESEQDSAFRGGRKISDFGFPGTKSPLRRRSPETVIIGILGGSVAREMADTSLESLSEELKRIPEFSGRRCEFVRLAVDGYKQPQQLMIVTWLLTLGAEFDVLVNLDGVNEAALPAIDNVPSGVFAAYPRNWHQLITSSSSIEAKRRIGLITWMRTELRDQAEFFSRRPLCWSGTATLIWHGLYNHRSQMIVNELTKLSDIDSREMPWTSTGPEQHFRNRKEMYRHSVDLWKRSSRLLHLFCRSNGIRYFHFLQPNQYVPDSKPMQEDERRIALSEQSPFREPVQICYPMMQAAARSLQVDGVAFHDLSQLFADTEVAVYRDDCCHVHDHGGDLMAREIGRRIAAALATESESESEMETVQ